MTKLVEKEYDPEGINKNIHRALRANFRDESGKLFVVYCPQCGRENWGPAVASGQCAWCGWVESSEK